MPQPGVISSENESGGFPMSGWQTPLPVIFYAMRRKLANQTYRPLWHSYHGLKMADQKQPLA
jgi:hypothetical protein